MSPKRLTSFLILSNIISVGAVCALAVMGFVPAKAKFSEIDADRINILGENGKPVLVLSNKRLIPGPSMNGKSYPQAVSDGRQYFSGMIFFNQEGDEVGGLVYNGFKKESGYSAVGHLSFDQYKQNQVVALQYVDNGKTRRAGLGIWDRPTDVTLDGQLDLINQIQNASPAEREKLRAQLKASNDRGEGGVQRLFIGSQDKVAQIQLRDTKGRPRARLLVDEKDNARLEFLDAYGKVVSTYPPSPTP